MRQFVAEVARFTRLFASSGGPFHFSVRQNTVTFFGTLYAILSGGYEKNEEYIQMEKRWGFWLVVVFFGLGWMAPVARASSAPPSLVKQAEVEIPLRGVYIPKNGFDDNDRVEAVLAGELPNPCYTLDRAYAEKTADGTGFVVHQSPGSGTAVPVPRAT